MPKIILADDHVLIRRGLKQILTEDAANWEVTEAENTDQTIELICREDWDVLVLDISMPGRSGIEALQEVKALRPLLPVLILSMHPEEQFAVRVLKAGASGYLNKAATAHELVNALNLLSQGGSYVSPAVADRLVQELQGTGTKPCYADLSNRELEVLRMIGAGKTSTEIAGELFLSVKTVSTYKTRIQSKLNLSTGAQLIAYAIKNQIVEERSFTAELLQ